jgi:hypothetical protein
MSESSATKKTSRSDKPSDCRFGVLNVYYLGNRHGKPAHFP